MYTCTMNQILKSFLSLCFRVYRKLKLNLAEALALQEPQNLLCLTVKILPSNIKEIQYLYLQIEFISLVKFIQSTKKGCFECRLLLSSSRKSYETDCSGSKASCGSSRALWKQRGLLEHWRIAGAGSHCLGESTCMTLG